MMRGKFSGVTTVLFMFDIIYKKKIQFVFSSFSFGYDDIDVL